MSTPNNDYPSMIREYANEQLKREHNAIEQMCERMLTTPGAPGISVQRTWSGSGTTMSCTTEVRLNPEVPFGTIGYLPDIFESGF